MCNRAITLYRLQPKCQVRVASRDKDPCFKALIHRNSLSVKPREVTTAFPQVNRLMSFRLFHSQWHPPTCRSRCDTSVSAKHSKMHRTSGEVFLQSGAITAVKCCVALRSDTALCQRASSKREEFLWFLDQQGL